MKKFGYSWVRVLNVWFLTVNNYSLEPVVRLVWPAGQQHKSLGRPTRGILRIVHETTTARVHRTFTQVSVKEKTVWNRFELMGLTRSYALSLVRFGWKDWMGLILVGLKKKRV
jgi:hypothetical protein